MMKRSSRNILVSAGATGILLLMAVYVGLRTGFWRGPNVLPGSAVVISLPAEILPAVTIPAPEKHLALTTSNPVCVRGRIVPPSSGEKGIHPKIYETGKKAPPVPFSEADIQSVKRLVYGSGGGAPVIPLRDDERDRLTHFLVTRGSPEAFDAVAFNALKNDTMDRLWAGASSKMATLSLMADLYQDRQQDEVIRDYAIQHLGQWYRESPDKLMVEKILRAALVETDGSIAGSALLALSRLSETCPELDRPVIARFALRYASSDETGNLTRITALQVCCEMGVGEVLPVAERLARPGLDMPIRISAIAVLGKLGGSAARGRLEECARDPDPWVAKAARVALKNGVRQEKTSL